MNSIEDLIKYMKDSIQEMAHDVVKELEHFLSSESFEKDLVKNVKDFIDESKEDLKKELRDLLKK